MGENDMKITAYVILLSHNPGFARVSGGPAPSRYRRCPSMRCAAARSCSCVQLGAAVFKRICSHVHRKRSRRFRHSAWRVLRRSCAKMTTTRLGAHGTRCVFASQGHHRWPRGRASSNPAIAAFRKRARRYGAAVAQTSSERQVFGEPLIDPVLVDLDVRASGSSTCRASWSRVLVAVFTQQRPIRVDIDRNWTPTDRLATSGSPADTMLRRGGRSDRVSRDRFGERPAQAGPAWLSAFDPGANRCRDRDLHAARSCPCAGRVFQR